MRGRRHSSAGIRRGIRAMPDSLSSVPILGFTTGLVMRLESDLANVTLVGSSPTRVSAIVDTSASASAHDHAQALEVSQPLWNVAQVNGYTSVHCATPRGMTAAAHADFAVGTDSWLWWSVVRRPTAGTYSVFRGFGSNASADAVRVFVRSDEKLAISYGTDGQFYTGSTASFPNDTWTFAVAGIDSSTGEVIYKIGANAIERFSVTVSGTGASTVDATLHGDAAGAYRGDSFHCREEAFHKLGAVAVNDSDIDAIGTYVQEKYGIATS